MLAHEPDDVRRAAASGSGGASRTRVAAIVRAAESRRESPPVSASASGLPRSCSSAASRTSSGAPASAARLHDLEHVLVERQVLAVGSPARSRSPARTRAGGARARRCRARAAAPCAGCAPSRSFESSPSPSAASPPPIRSPETCASCGAHSRIWRSVSSSGSRPSCETKRRPRTIRSGSSRKLVGLVVRRTPRSRSSRPPSGSSTSPVSSRRAIALIVKSRRSMSCSSEIAGVGDDLEVVAARARSSARRAAARTRSPPAASARASVSRGSRRTPTRWSATIRSSTRPCGSSAARSSAWPTPGTTKSCSRDRRARAARRGRRRRRRRRRGRASARSRRPRPHGASSCAVRRWRDGLDLDERAGGKLGRPRPSSGPAGGRRRGARRPRSCRRSRRGSGGRRSS